MKVIIINLWTSLQPWVHPAGHNNSEKFHCLYESMADEFGNTGGVSKKELTELRHKKKSERVEAFGNLRARCPLGAEEIAITALNLSVLTEKLQSREFKAKQVLAAYIAKALDLTDDLNCITEFVPQCFEWAEELDRADDIKGPLHGVPFCVKDDIDIAGMDSTLGCSVNLYRPKLENAVVVEALRGAGAFPFCKTNVPQAIIAAACENPIFGRTLNPFNRKLGPGVSSGGTGCLVAAGGAPFGIGSDLGGSVRIPSHFCGVTGLCPTLGRHSSKGITECYSGIAGLAVVPGMIAPTVDALIQIHRAVWTDGTQAKLDPNTVPIPWNELMFSSTRNLRIGYFTELPLIPPVGDTASRVLEAKTALESKGHILIPFQVPDALRLYQIYLTLRYAEQHNQIRNMLQNDTIINSLEEPPLERILPTPIKDVMSKLASRYSSERTKATVPDLSARSSEILWKYLVELRDLQNKVFRDIKELNLDALLSPTLPFPATNLELLDVSPLHFGIYAYTSIWNALKYPSGVVPFGKESGASQNAHSDDIYLQIATKIACEAKDMPIGVQVIGLPFQEEMILRIMRELEQLQKI